MNKKYILKAEFVNKKYILKAEVPGVKTPPIFLIFRQILGSERETH